MICIDAKMEMVSGAAYAGVYRAATSFDDLKLKAELHHGVMSMGFSTPSKIQAEALPLIMSAS
jgi:superfamily II DNA/RNA helicase